MEIRYAQTQYIASFRQALDQVAREKIHIEMIEAPSLEAVLEFTSSLIKNNYPAYFAVTEDKVVGWCDILPLKNPRQTHRGTLGMGVLPKYRGQGLGSKLLKKAISHCALCGVEKVELHVYMQNKAAIALYEKFGFSQEGVIKSYRKLDGQTYDCLTMAKFVE